MTGPALAPGHRWTRGLPLLTVLAALAIALGAAPQPVAARLARWTGGVDLYRTGTFTTQQTWLWCTAADVQIMRNIVDHRRDHSRSAQQAYFSYMRRHDRYAIPVSDGVDPAGWTAGLHHFVDTRYRLVASGSFSSALRSAVRNLRLTGLPVGITVSHGNHAWILTGFTATADPAVTSRFTVTSVRVVGPLWGLQSRSYGYDMRPDTRLTPRQLRGFFTPWHYAGVRMAWEGDWVSIQPVATATDKAQASTAKPKPTPSPTPHGSPSTTTAPPSSPTPAASSASDPAASVASASASRHASDDRPAVALVAPASGSPIARPTPRTLLAGDTRDPPGFDFDAGFVALLLVIVAAGSGAVWASARGRSRRQR